MRKCRVCKKPFKPHHSTLEKQCSYECNMAWLRSPEAQEGMAAARRKVDHHHKQEKKKRKSKSLKFKRQIQAKDVSYQLKTTRPVFNRMRVLEELQWFAERGIEPFCISCQRTKADWSCGHFKTVGSQGNLRFDRMNTYLQCLGNCNRHRSGNIGGTKTSVGYRLGLLDRFGGEEGRRIIDYCETHTDKVKWDPAWLISFRAECRSKIRTLEKELAA